MKVTVHVVGDSGAVLAHEVVEPSSHPAGRPLVVAWTPFSDEAVVRIEVFAYDVDGYYKGIAITPWSVVIPHEDANFKHDSSQIEEPERPKREASFVKVSAIRFQCHAVLTLYRPRQDRSEIRVHETRARGAFSSRSQ
ncbi:MAG TPA: hypothetical protein VGY54_04060 [Polyangiaceae bacterium]|nr:hypothetical protein [Polyangiaceae bacterium]